MQSDSYKIIEDNIEGDIVSEGAIEGQVNSNGEVRLIEDREVASESFFPWFFVAALILILIFLTIFFIKKRKI